MATPPRRPSSDDRWGGGGGAAATGGKGTTIPGFGAEWGGNDPIAEWREWARRTENKLEYLRRNVHDALSKIPATQHLMTELRNDNARKETEAAEHLDEIRRERETL